MSEEAKPKTRERVELEHRLTIISIVATAVVGVASLAVSIWAIRSTDHPTASRVEISKLALGVNGISSPHGSWKLYTKGYSLDGKGDTVELGFRKVVKLKVPFKSRPSVAAYVNGVTMKTPLQIAQDLGIKVTDADERRRLSLPSFFVFHDDLDNASFYITMGLSLPRKVAKPLLERLRGYRPKTQREIQDDIDWLKDQGSKYNVQRTTLFGSKIVQELTEDDRQMVAFSRLVGYLGCDYIASGDAK